MSYVVWGGATLVLIAAFFFATTFLVPRSHSGTLLLKQEMKRRGIPHDHLPDQFFSDCVAWAGKIADFTGHGTTIKKRAEFVRAIETLVNMIDLWRREPGSPMFATHGGQPSTYHTLFEPYDLRHAP